MEKDMKAEWKTLRAFLEKQIKNGCTTNDKSESLDGWIDALQSAVDLMTKMEADIGAVVSEIDWM